MKTPLPPLMKNRAIQTLAFLFAINVSSLSAQTVYDANSTSGNWSDPTKWTAFSGTGTTFPNGIGDVARRVSGSSSTMTQNVGSDIILGGAILGETASGSFTLSLSAGNGIIFNNGGSGVLLENSTGATSGRLSVSSGNITLADNLTISNASTSATKTSGAISISSTISGTGNITIQNVTNSLASGFVQSQNKNNSFIGSTTIESGAFTMSNSGNPTGDNSFFGDKANTVTLGKTSGGSVSLVAQGYSSYSILQNQIVVAASTGGTTVIGSTNINAALVDGSALFSGTIALNQDVTLLSAVVSPNVAVNPTNTTVYSGPITGTGGITVLGSASSLGLTDVALGTTQLNGINTFSGITRIASGTLAIGANGGGTNSLALQNSTVDLNVADSGSLVFGTAKPTGASSFFPDDSTITSATFGGLQGSRNLALANYAAGAVALSVGNNNANTTYSGTLSGAGSLAKIGTGTLKLSSANTYIGTTTITAGTLLVNGSVSNGNVIVNGGTLGGTGLIAPTGANGLTVNSGGVVAPGDGGIGGLEINLASTSGAASFLSNSTFTFELNAPGSSDVLTFTGLTASSSDVVFNANVINFSDLGGMAPGLYTLMTFDANDAYTGSLAVGTGLGGYTGNFIYNNNNIQLNVVPEPTTVALLAIGVSLTLFGRRGRRPSKVS